MNNNMHFCAYSKAEIYNKVYLASQSGFYVSYLRGLRCRNEDLFFHEISASFQFPYYFGENWTAMDECLCDLEWINACKVFVVIDDFSQLFSEQKEIMDILQSKVIKYFEIMIHYWREQNVAVEVWLNN